jgi:hypothetical protein
MKRYGNFTAMLRMDFYRAFGSYRFLAAILLTCALYLVSSGNEIKMLANGRNEVSVVYFFDAVNNYNTLMDILLVICVLPYSMSFCADWKNRYIRAIAIRTTSRTYSWSRVITCFISSFAAVIAGIMLYVCLMALFFPLYHANSYDPDSGAILGQLLAADQPLLYLLGYGVIRGASSAFWAVFGIVCSSYIPNVFLALSAPLIGFKLLVDLQYWFRLPLFLSVDYISEGFVPMGNWWQSLAYAVALFVAGAVVLGFIFQSKVKKGIANV